MEVPRLAATTLTERNNSTSNFNVMFVLRFIGLCLAPQHINVCSTSLRAGGPAVNSSLASFFQRRNIAHILAQLLRLQQAPHDLPTSRFWELFRKRNFRWHRDSTQDVPHVVL